MKFDVIDGCVVPREIADEVREVKRRSGATLVSCYRGDKATGLLRRLGKSTQSYLYDAFRKRLAGVPGFGWANPANPPGASTHELFNDGVAYPGPARMPLAGWKVGMDWDIPHAQNGSITKAFAQIGWTVTLTYPTSTRERQHLNARRRGRQWIPFRALKSGSSSARVAKLRRQLGYVHDPDTDAVYTTAHAKDNKGHKLGAKADRTFGPELERALKAFQRDWQQKPDGVYGKQTHDQLQSRVRARSKKLKEQGVKRRQRARIQKGKA